MDVYAFMDTRYGNTLYNVIFYEELILRYLRSLGIDIDNLGYAKFWLHPEMLDKYCKWSAKWHRITKCGDIALDLGQISETEMLRACINVRDGEIFNTYNIKDAGHSEEYTKAKNIKNKYLLSGYKAEMIILGGKIVEVVSSDKLNLTSYHSGVICDRRYNHVVYSKNYVPENLGFICGIDFKSSEREIAGSIKGSLTGIGNIKDSIINQDKTCQCINFGEMYSMLKCSLYGGWYNIDYIHALKLININHSILRAGAVDNLGIGTCTKSILEIGEVFLNFDIEYTENVVVILHSDMNEQVFNLIRHSLSMMNCKSSIVVKNNGKSNAFNSIFIALAKCCRKTKVYIMDYWEGKFTDFLNVTGYKESDFEALIKHEVSLWE